MGYIFLIALCFAAAIVAVNSIMLRDESRLTTACMECGAAPYCGLIVLERGGGPSAYSHSEPCLHGLWPEVPSYGDSDCVVPAGDINANVTAYMDCYTDSSFATHEWQAHGYCASRLVEKIAYIYVYTTTTTTTTTTNSSK